MQSGPSTVEGDTMIEHAILIYLIIGWVIGMSIVGYESWKGHRWRDVELLTILAVSLVYWPLIAIALIIGGIRCS